MVNANGLAVLRQFLMEYGSILGLSWTAVFGLYVAGIRTQDGTVLLAAFLGLFIILGLTFMLGMRAKVRSVQLQVRLSPFFSFVNIFSMFMYASLLCGAMEYAYFQFLDKGALSGALQTMFADAELRMAYQQMGMLETYKQLREIITEVGTLSALDKVLLLFNQNFFVGLIVAIPVTITYWFYKPKATTL